MVICSGMYNIINIRGSLDCIIQGVSTYNYAGVYPRLAIGKVQSEVQVTAQSSQHVTLDPQEVTYCFRKGHHGSC